MLKDQRLEWMLFLDNTHFLRQFRANFDNFHFMTDKIRVRSTDKGFVMQ